MSPSDTQPAAPPTRADLLEQARGRVAAARELAQRVAGVQTTLALDALCDALDLLILADQEPAGP